MDARELLDIIIPEHGRTSCGDEDCNNGIEKDGNFRCSRCAILDVVEGRIDEEEFREIYKGCETHFGFWRWS